MMDRIGRIDKNYRPKNYFNLFYKQNLSSIRNVFKPTPISNENSERNLIFLKKEPLTNQYENIPSIETEKISSIEKDYVLISDNEKALKDTNFNLRTECENDKSSKDNSGVDIKMESVQNNHCEINNDTFNLPKVKDVEEHLAFKKVKDYQFSDKKIKQNQNSIFCRFKKS